ncbi:MAG: hypothetical protein JXR86_14665 [Spirochaetales bacterium]|nr:hypothetical protein [Spirochaetales bacterium]
MKKTAFLLIFIVSTAISFPLFGEQAALVLENISIGNEASLEKIKAQVREKLTEELERQNLLYRDETYVASAIASANNKPEEYDRSETVLQLGEAADVPVVLVVSVHEKGSLLEIAITAWDIAGKKAIATERSVSKSEITQYIMIDSSITRIVSKLTGEYGVQIAMEEPKVRKITFLSNQEGMEVYLSSGELLGTIIHSVLNVTDREYEIGTRLLIVKKLKGYRSSEQYVYLDRERSVAPLGDLVKAQTLALEFNWTYTQLMGAGTGIRFYPIPDWLYVSFDSYFYLQKDFSSDSGLEMTHNDLRLLGGLYLGLGPGSIFRVSASLGLGIIVSYPLNSNEVYFDTYINAVNLALELNLDDWSFYLRPELRIFLGIGESSLNKGGISLSEWNVPQISLGVMRKW